MRKLSIVLLFILSTKGHATGLPVLDIPNTAQNIISVVLNGIKSGYQYVIKQKQVAALLETYKVVARAKQHYESIVGNFNYSSVMNLLQDRELREYAPDDWNQTVDAVSGAKTSIWTTFSRLHGAATSFDNGNVPYLDNVVYIDRKVPTTKHAAEKYKEIYNRNKTYSVMSETALNQTHENIQQTQLLIDKIEIADTPNKKNDLRNTILTNLAVASNEQNRQQAMANKQLADMNTEKMQRRAGDVMAYSGDFKPTFWR